MTRTLDPEKCEDVSKKTEACHTLEVTFEDEDPVTVDPVLIINP